MSALPEVTFITGNKKKLEEVIAILGDDIPFKLVSMKLDLPELQGEPIEVSVEKCKHASLQVIQIANVKSILNYSVDRLFEYYLFLGGWSSDSRGYQFMF